MTLKPNRTDPYESRMVYNFETGLYFDEIFQKIIKKG